MCVSTSAIPTILPPGRGPDTIPLDHLKKNAVIMAVFIYHASIAEEVLPRAGAR